MKDLLLKWAELEPESRCRITYEDAVEFRLSTDRILIAPLDLEPEQYSEEMLAYIQFAIQDAIVSKGWDFHFESVRHSADGGTSYGSTVFAAVEDIETDFWGCSSIAAESLLSAYLKALEAVEAEEAA